VKVSRTAMILACERLVVWYGMDGQVAALLLRLAAHDGKLWPTLSPAEMADKVWQDSGLIGWAAHVDEHDREKTTKRGEAAGQCRRNLA